MRTLQRTSVASLLCLAVVMIIEHRLARGEDCNHNGQEDATDIAMGSSRDCNANRVPDECDVIPTERLGPPMSLPTEWKISEIYLGDFDRDGRVPDFALIHRDDRKVSALLQGPAGMSLTPDIDPAAVRKFGAAVFLDANEFTDSVFTSPFAAQVIVVFNRESATREERTFPACGEPCSVDAQDLEGDGDTDLILTMQDGSERCALVNDGAGNLGVPTALDPQATPCVRAAAAVIDIDQDQDADRVEIDPQGGKAMLVYLNDPVPAASADQDGNGIPDECEGGFLRTDATADGNLDITDPISVLLFLFGGQQLACLEAADSDNSGRVDTTDAVLILGYLFRGEAPPPGPGPPGAGPCGPDTDTPGSPGDLGCAAYEGCGAA